MLVDKDIHDYWASRYQVLNPIKRYGIIDEAGEGVVELYLKQFNLYPVPMAKLFKFESMMRNTVNFDPEADVVPIAPIFISRVATMKLLERKVMQVLSTYLFFELKNKSTMVRSVRLWRSKYAAEAAK